MKCLDDCHTYQMSTFMRKGIETPGTPTIHFYEMREHGTKVDGVTNEEVLSVLIHRLQYLNETWQGGKFRCRENSLAITKLEEALMWLNKRTLNRLIRGVEGTHKP